jgi:heme-degrading monooxygenase HmoA
MWLSFCQLPFFLSVSRTQISKEEAPFRKEQNMYVAIRRMKAKPGSIDEAVRRVEDGLVPIISSVSGFVEYDVVQVGEDVGLTISVFETQEQAEESNRRAAEWVKQNLTPLAAGPHEIVAVGEVRIHKGKQAG